MHNTTPITITCTLLHIYHHHHRAKDTSCVHKSYSTLISYYFSTESALWADIYRCAYEHRYLLQTFFFFCWTSCSMEVASKRQAIKRWLWGVRGQKLGGHDKHLVEESQATFIWAQEWCSSKVLQNVQARPMGLRMVEVHTAFQAQNARCNGLPGCSIFPAHRVKSSHKWTTPVFHTEVKASVQVTQDRGNREFHYIYAAMHKAVHLDKRGRWERSFRMWKAAPLNYCEKHLRPCLALAGVNIAYNALPAFLLTTVNL